MDIKELVCIGCPMGCPLQVKMENGEVLEVTGHTCRRGAEYGKKECTNPTRIVTSTVVVKDGEIDALPVKTEKDIPKDKIFECVIALKEIEINAPVNIGDIVVKNVADTGVDIIATKKVNKVC